MAEEEERGGWGVSVGVRVGMGRRGFGWGSVESVEQARCGGSWKASHGGWLFLVLGFFFWR